MDVLAETGLEMGLMDVTMVVNRMDTVRTLLPVSRSRCLPIKELVHPCCSTVCNSTIARFCCTRL